MTQKCTVNYFHIIDNTRDVSIHQVFFFNPSPNAYTPWRLIPAPRRVVHMTDPVEIKNRRDRGCLSFKTYFSEEVQDVLAEMCNVFMLTGLDWISDGQKVVTDSHGVSVGMKKMFKYHYHNQ